MLHFPCLATAACFPSVKPPQIPCAPHLPTLPFLSVIPQDAASDLASALERAIAGPRPAAAVSARWCTAPRPRELRVTTPSAFASGCQRGVTDGESACLTPATRLSPQAIDLETLCIQQGQRCWVLFIDAVVLNADGTSLPPLPRATPSRTSTSAQRPPHLSHARTIPPPSGNELDAISVAAKAALADVKIPKVTVVPGASADEPAELELDDDPGVAVRLDVREAPVLVTVSKCGRHYVVDATSEEQTHVDCAVTLAVTEGGAVRGAANRGSAGLPAAAAQEMVRFRSSLFLCAPVCHSCV